MTKKFIVKPSPMLQAVEEIYLRLVGDYWGASDREFIKSLKEILNRTTRHTVHINLLVRNFNNVVFETSKYVQGTGEYMGHTLWIFHKEGEGKYSWTLNRYTI